MKTTVSIYDFRDAFRAVRPNNFSHEGLEVLFDYLEQYEQDTGEELELDVIALCCDFSEDTAAEIAQNYSIDLNDADPEDDDYEEQCENIIREYLEGEGVLIGEVAGGFVYRDF